MSNRPAGIRGGENTPVTPEERFAPYISYDPGVPVDLMLNISRDITRSLHFCVRCYVVMQNVVTGIAV